jgi:ribonuclease VapC
VDTSAIMAVLRQEPGHEVLSELLKVSRPRLMAGPTAVEVGIVIGSRTRDFGRWQRVLRESAIEVIAFDERLVARAVDAFRRFGKGRHPAGLNFGDCCTYALAEERGLPILCVGGDFRRTDLPVLPEFS